MITRQEFEFWHQAYIHHESNAYMFYFDKTTLTNVENRQFWEWMRQQGTPWHKKRVLYARFIGVST
ncbi:gp47 [Burkholderia phage BcepB1A]|uniref:gp47 n=1 Tax=Burkholderia phage BcepB1A TaxID=279530 RepID=UPI000053EA66|nr:gp47 [Burkholderia phage BcepB1A]AAY87917.1 gp47 [Burkholderia phage BcepB1A]